MRHTISILLQNEAGALVRVAGLFSSRGYNIESLHVAPTQDNTVSRLTLVTTGSDDVIHQICNQLLKLVDVVDLLDMTEGEHFERELLLLKACVPESGIAAAATMAEAAGARTLDARPEAYTVELTASGPDIERFVTEMRSVADVLSVVRSGTLAMACGPGSLEHGDSPATDHLR